MSEPSRPIALVTGASSGIGAVYADRLARRDYDLLLVARNADRLQELAQTLETNHGVIAEVMIADLGSGDDLRRVEQRIRSDARISILVNNAGLLANGPLAGAEPDDIEAMLDVNVLALTRLAAAAAASFSTQKRGAIINLSSAMAMINTPRTAVYGASKAYVLELTRSLDDELRPQGVQVQAVLPGYTRTPMIGNGGGLPDNAVMDVEVLVDVALAGLDQNELVTIPGLPDPSGLEVLKSARASLLPFLSLRQPADRYGVSAKPR